MTDKANVDVQDQKILPIYTEKTKTHKKNDNMKIRKAKKATASHISITSLLFPLV
jgi:hypothetical protein